MVAFGYRQVQEVKYSKNYSLNITDVTFQIVLLIIIYFGLLAKVFNIKTVFL